jgi:hypothetical protein
LGEMGIAIDEQRFHSLGFPARIIGQGSVTRPPS